MDFASLLKRTAPLIVAAGLAACGGSGITPASGPIPSDGPARTSRTIVSTGVAAIDGQSLHVTGVRWTTSASTIVRVNGKTKSFGALKSGMVVKVRGERDGATAMAEEIDAENEIRGTVTAVDAAGSPKSFNIGMQKVIVNSETKYSDLPNDFDSIAVGVQVEVYGLRDATGAIVATHVEGLNVPELPDEIKGTVSALNAAASTFQIGDVVVTFAGATFAPAGATASSLANGLRVEVDGKFDAAGTTFAATRVEIDDRTADGELEIEGFVSLLAVANGSGSFNVGAQKVTFDGTTRFRNGTLANLADNVRVEVEGALLGDTLRASVIAFKPPAVVLTGRPSAVSATSLTLFGKTIAIGAQTNLVTPIAEIVAGTTRVEVRVRLESDGALTATRIADVGNRFGAMDTVQAIVTAESEAAAQITVLGLTVSVATAEFTGLDGSALTLAQFFAASTVNESLVKVKGAFAAPASFTADEVELED